MISGFTAFNFIFAGMDLVIAIALFGLGLRYLRIARQVAAYKVRVTRECEDLWTEYSSKIALAIDHRRSELKTVHALDRVNQLRAEYKTPTVAGKFYIGTNLLTTSGLDWKRCTLDDGTDSLSYRAAVMNGNEQDCYFTLVINVHTRDAVIYEVRNYVSQQVVSFQPTGIDEPEALRKEREDFREAFFVSACTAVNTLCAV